MADAPSPSSDSSDASLLLVDDEDDILELLGYNFRKRGFDVRCARNGVEALALAQDDPPDLIILDVMMPEMDGIETCRRLRADAHLRTIPVMMLTARTEEEHQVEGLDVGADIYVGKPVAIPVIVSQVKALLRSAERHATPPDALQVYDLLIDRDRFLVMRGSGDDATELHFPRKEFELLHFLASSPGQVYTRQEILDEVWGPDVYVVDRTVDVHVRKIRKKIGKAYIETVKGVGYRFTDTAPN